MTPATTNPMTPTPQIELRQTESLVGYQNNARTHSPAQIEQLMSSLLEFGWTNPVLVDGYGIVAGHGRVMAADKLYQRGESIRFPSGEQIPVGVVPVINVAGWPHEKRKAYILADNQLALNAGWDEALLRTELQDLDEAGYDLSLTGFDEDFLATLLADEPSPLDADPDAVPDGPVEPVTVEGDIWQLGPHRVACADSTDPLAWSTLMQGELADVAITDPPYNVDLAAKNRLLDGAHGFGSGRSQTGAIVGDKLPDDEFQQLIAGAYACLFDVLKPGSTIYVSHSDKAGDVFRNEFSRAGFKFSQSVIWKKNQHVLGNAPYQPIHEPIIVGRKPGSKNRWYGGRTQKTVIETGVGGPISQDEDGRWLIRVGDAVLVVDGHATLEEHPGSVICVPKPQKSGLHASTKPVELWERLIKNSARQNDIVVDAFAGSGTTVVAAERLGMIARVVELEPRHVDTICLRYYHLTGRRPVHAVTGELFPVDGEVRAPAADSGLDGLASLEDVF